MVIASRGTYLEVLDKMRTLALRVRLHDLEVMVLVWVDGGRRRLLTEAALGRYEI